MSTPTRYTDPVRVAAFLRCTLAPAGVTLRDEGGRYVIVQPDWRWLQPEVDARQAGIRAVLAEWAQDAGQQDAEQEAGAGRLAIAPDEAAKWQVTL